jgi:hypothetical protein
MSYRLKTDLNELIGPRFNTREESFAYACGARDAATDETEAAVIDGWTLWFNLPSASNIDLVAMDFANRRRVWELRRT